MEKSRDQNTAHFEDKASAVENVNSKLQNLALECDSCVSSKGGAIKKKHNLSTKLKNKSKLDQSETDIQLKKPPKGPKSKHNIESRNELSNEKASASSLKGNNLRKSSSSDPFEDRDVCYGMHSAVCGTNTPKKTKDRRIKQRTLKNTSEGIQQTLVCNSKECYVESQAVAKEGITNCIPDTPDYLSVKKTPSRKKPRSPKKNCKFEPYIPLCEVQQGLKRGEFIEGALRINPRNYEDAYVSSPDGRMDIYIGGIRDRNRALNGDLVVVQVKPKQEWKVLCEAIKDYQERCGQSIFDSPHLSTAPSPQCKVHTPEKHSKSHPSSSSSWDNTSGERLPDSLEILGVDRFARQYDQLSKEAKKKNRSKRNRLKHRSQKGKSDEDKDAGSQKSSVTSFSQDSSEDCLGRLSSKHSSNCKKTVVTEANCENKNCSVNSSDKMKHCDDSVDGCIDSEDRSNFRSCVKSICSDQIGCESVVSMVNDSFCKQKLNLQENNCKNSECEDPWITKEDSYNQVISPEELLNLEDGNSLELYASRFHEEEEVCRSDDSNIAGIIVAPDDLSEDDFSDSSSAISTYSPHIDQLLEDADFLACQQDAQNNNVGDIDQENNDINEEMVNGSIITMFKPLEDQAEPDDIKEYKSQFPVVNSSDILAKASFDADVTTTSEGISHQEMFDQSTVLCNVVEGPDKTVFNEKVVYSEHPPGKKHNKINKAAKRRRNKLRKAKQNEENVQKNAENVPNLNLPCVNSLMVEQVMNTPLGSKFVQKTGKVVFIKERKHPCVAAGHIKLLQDRSNKWALFSPNDNRLPRIFVPMSDCPVGFYERPSDFAKTLFIACINEWNEDSTFARGSLIKTLGETGQVEPETEGILLENGVEYGDFPDEILECLPKNKDWVIPDEEIAKRRDFRSECIFTIDPATARDMDDAVSCNVLPNGNYEVGVHIADVTYFVHEGTMLDDVAKSRATSVYLVQKVVPMLPRVLCDELCSLNPGKDRLTFSVLWELNQNGDVIKEWFGRSVIRSCMKMSYEHAQDMIVDPGKVWKNDEHPEIYGNFTMADLVKRVFQLHLLAQKLREKRFCEGALRLDQMKLQFTLDVETGLPSGFSVYEQKDSNKLIEEFMLLANIAVAHKIYNEFPHLALLRRHPPPQMKPMEDVVSTCAVMGIHLDATTSGTLQLSLSKYFGTDSFSQARCLILTHLCSKPMNCALYFCSGCVEDTTLYHHYALNVPLYTHFTSPIRRYPDIIVHRLLGAALKYNTTPSMKEKEMQRCADHCNDKKYAARRVSEISAELFLAVFVQECGPLDAQAMVMGVMDHSFDCLILHLGIIKRVYCDKLPLKKKDFKKQQGIPSLTLVWKSEVGKNYVVQNITMFTLVEVTLIAVPSDALRINAILKMPSDR